MPAPRWVRLLLNLPEPKPAPPTEEPVRPTRTVGPGLTVLTPSRVDDHDRVAPWQVRELDAAAQKPDRWQRVIRWLALVLVGLMVWQGVKATFLRPEAAPPAPAPTAATGVDVAAAGVATRFATAYATWDEDHPTARRDALAPFWGGDPTAGWNGKGRQQVTAATVEAAHVDAAGSRVTIRLSITPWTIDPTAKSRINGKPFDAGLEVPIATGDGTAAVVGLPTWVALALPGPVQPVGVTQPDSAFITQTQPAIVGFFTAYGRDVDVSTITAPGSTLVGLGGRFTLGSVKSWQVGSPTNDEAHGRAVVEWIGLNQATIEQSYTVTLRQTTSGTQTRWQVYDLSSR